MKKIIIRIATVLIITSLLNTKQVSALEHPFLIVKSTEYQLLRDKASTSPWKEMKSAAINDCLQLKYESVTADEMRSWMMREIMSSCSLAYILDPGNKQSYINKLITTWEKLDDIRRIQTADNKWLNVVPPGVAAFNSILALDIVFNDLTSTQRTQVESKLNTLVQFYASETRWPPSAPGISGLWALYKGNRTDIDKYKSQYKSQFLGSLSGDGVFLGGTGYAGFRFSEVRDTKAVFKDILEYTGEDKTYYTNPVIKNFYEWYYGYAATPFNKDIAFGDSAAFFGYFDPHRDYIRSQSPNLPNALAISDQAAKSAAWRKEAVQQPGRLLNYLFLKQDFPSPQLPPSRIFPNGGAFFQLANSDKNSLYGALWNVKNSAPHQRKDVNAIYLAGYGEVLLNNVGFEGTGDPSLGFSWQYISNRAVSNNTVLINYTVGVPTLPSSNNDHQGKTGNGIIEGFTSEGLDYALGDSGSALPNGRHKRQFMFSHPRDNENGYFVVIDNVVPNTANANANIAFHPYSDTITEVSARQEYKAVIGPNTLTSNQAALTVFYAQQPTSVNLVNGVFADWTESIVGKYLFASFPLGSTTAGKNIITVLYPHDKSHAKAGMQRVSGSGYMGAKVTGNSAVDYVLESQGSLVKVAEGTSFKGTSAIFRLKSGNVLSYFAGNSTEFSDKDTPTFGFSSDKGATVFMNQVGKGHIISTGANVTFYFPGITNVKLNGVVQTPDSKTQSSIKILVPAGTHQVELVSIHSSPSPSSSIPTFTKGDVNHDSQVNTQDMFLIVTNLGKSVASVTGYLDPVGDVKINLLDAGYVVRDWGN